MGLRFQLEDFPLFFFAIDSEGGLFTAYDGLLFGTDCFRVAAGAITDDLPTCCRFGESDFRECLTAALRGELPPGYLDAPL